MAITLYEAREEKLEVKMKAEYINTSTDYGFMKMFEEEAFKVAELAKFTPEELLEY